MSWKRNQFDRDFFLTHTGRVWECEICKQSAFNKDEIEHADVCVFADKTVTGVKLSVTPERDFEICGYCTHECPIENDDLVTHDRCYQICCHYKKAVDLCGG